MFSSQARPMTNPPPYNARVHITGQEGSYPYNLGDVVGFATGGGLELGRLDPSPLVAHGATIIQTLFITSGPLAGHTRIVLLDPSGMYGSDTLKAYWNQSKGERTTNPPVFDGGTPGAPVYLFENFDPKFVPGSRYSTFYDTSGASVARKTQWL